MKRKQLAKQVFFFFQVQSYAGLLYRPYVSIIGPAGQEAGSQDPQETIISLRNYNCWIEHGGDKYVVGYVADRGGFCVWIQDRCAV